MVFFVTILNLSSALAFQPVKSGMARDGTDVKMEHGLYTVIHK